MKLMWFHLMPYTELPDDFRDKHNSVWVDIHSSLFDPSRAHLMYNDFMDELEFAADCGFDAICVNEHHSNGYGLMPSPNLIASALARRTNDAMICVMGNSLALYNPPTRVAEEFAMIDCISGGRLIAGFPVGTPMDTCYAYGTNPSMLRDKYLEAHDLVIKAWTERRNLRLQRQIQSAEVCQHLAATGAAAASADLDPRRRIGRNMALVRRDGLRLLLPVLLWLQSRSGDDEGFLGRDGSARQGPQSRTALASCSSSAWPRAVPRRWSGTRKRRSISTAVACTSTVVMPHRQATTLRQRSVTVSRARSNGPPRRPPRPRPSADTIDDSKVERPFCRRHSRHDCRLALQHGGARHGRHRRPRLRRRRLTR